MEKNRTKLMKELDRLVQTRGCAYDPWLVLWL